MKLNLGNFESRQWAMEKRVSINSSTPFVAAKLKLKDGQSNRMLVGL